jgi:hypothetical protein
MKKIILLITLCCATNISLAASYQAVVFNMSDKYDTTVTYQICSKDAQYQEHCDAEKSILINAKKAAEDKNYVIITQPTQDPGVSEARVNIISAVEKDENGNTVAKGKFFDASQHVYSDCVGNIYLADTSSPYGHYADAYIQLDDMRGSPYITCLHSNFVADNSSL